VHTQTSKREKMEQTLVEGVIEEIIYKNEANGYTVCEISSGSKFITAVGYMPFINEGETIKANGRWERHPDYGDQFRVEMYEKILPHTADAIEKYLASGIIRGVGPVTARKIVERFGASALDVISNEPGRLAEIRGISFAKAMDIGRVLNEQKGLQEVVMFLQEYGVSPSVCIKIYRAYGDKSVAMIRENPYRLCEDVFGIGFRTADRIAMKLGVDPASLFRIKSGIRYILAHAASNGHTYLPETMLRQYTAQLLGIPDDGIEDALVSLMFDRAIYTEKTEEGCNVYLAAFHTAETGVCKRLLALSRTSHAGDLEDLEEKIREFEQNEGIQLDPRQREAVREAMMNGVMVITGGPGTGKTTIIKCILGLLAHYGCRAALAAPTGRAAKRMTEATGHEAKTIHRLLEIGYTDDESEPVFQRNEANPLEADAVIIDETSMVDIMLMYHLLKAVPSGSRLILVGDADQLPSVGPGSVLHDIISCSGIRTVRFTEIFRQAEESLIIVNAHRINRGEAPILNAKDKDFFFLPRSGQESILRTVIDLCARRLPDTYGLDPMKDIQVLSPTKKGPAGVANLNVELQKALNPQDGKKAEKVTRGHILREGDRVMQVRNNYSLRWEKPGNAGIDGTGVFNGDMGTVVQIDDEEMKVSVQFDDDRLVVYDYSILDELEPAFAVTVHKSQGSEFPVVVMPIFPGPEVLMTRNLLYTAVTRAKEMVVLVGDEDVLLRMVGNKRETLRYSGLADKLKNFAAYADII